MRGQLDEPAGGSVEHPLELLDLPSLDLREGALDPP